MSSELPPPWALHLSKSKGKHYYFNSATGETYWRDDGMPFGWASGRRQGRKQWLNIRDGTWFPSPPAEVLYWRGRRDSEVEVAVEEEDATDRSGSGAGAAEDEEPAPKAPQLTISAGRPSPLTVLTGALSPEQLFDVWQSRWRRRGCLTR